MSLKYRARVRLRGHPHESATFDRLTDAREWIKATESAIREGRYFPSRSSMKHTLADAVERYTRDVAPRRKGAKKRSAQLRWWGERLGPRLLAELSPALIAEARDSLTTGPATANRYLAAMSHVCTVASKEWGWMETNPVRKVARLPEPPGRVRFLGPDEQSVLLSACQNRKSGALYVVVLLALSTGMRQGEILGLRWPDVDLSRGWILLHETKSGDRRGVPLRGAARESLEKWAKVRRLDTDKVFPLKSIRTAWLRSVAEAGLQDFRFHDLRHSAASYMAMNGASATEIAALLGHKTLQMVRRYAHLSDEHLDKIVDAMNMAFIRPGGPS